MDLGSADRASTTRYSVNLTVVLGSTIRMQSATTTSCTPARSSQKQKCDGYSVFGRRRLSTVKSRPECHEAQNDSYLSAPHLGQPNQVFALRLGHCQRLTGCHCSVAGTAIPSEWSQRQRGSTRGPVSAASTHSWEDIKGRPPNEWAVADRIIMARPIGNTRCPSW